VKPSEVLRGGIEQIKRRGWHQGGLWRDDPCTGPVCMAGALYAAADGASCADGVNVNLYSDDVLEASLVVEKVTAWNIAWWNDAPGRTRRQVLHATGRAARMLEAEGR